MKLKLAKEFFPVFWKIFFTGAVLTAAAFWAGMEAGKMFLALWALFFAFSFFFFREPVFGNSPEEPDFLFSPAYGTVLSTEKEGGGIVVRIFLSIFNVHVQYSPADCKTVSVTYLPGEFNLAFDKKAAGNERNVIVFENSGGIRFSVEQIAGFIARRITCGLKPGDGAPFRQRIGMIKFGSQIAVRLPDGAVPLVKKGERVNPLVKLARITEAK